MLRPQDWLWLPVALVIVALVAYRVLPRRGRALADRLSMFDVWDIGQGLLGGVALAITLYVLAEDAVHDRTTRMIFLVTAGVMVVVAGLGLAWRRRRRDRP